MEFKQLAKQYKSELFDSVLPFGYLIRKILNGAVTILV